jgi:N-acetylmuramoyl-L-alanine amidase
MKVRSDIFFYKKERKYMAKIKICLDAGYYGKYNQSPVVSEYYESDMAWKLHLKLKKYLEEYGIEVITTRAKQKKDLGLTSRGKAAEGCDLFLSIHSNAATKESVDYPIAFVPTNGSADELGSQLAKCIEQVMKTKQSGRAEPKKSEKGNWDYYSVINGAASVGVPGIILEHSFHTNTRATKWLMVDSNLDKLAKAEAKVIAEYFMKNSSVELPILSKGTKSKSVKALQTLLIGYGYSCGKTGADGDFGNSTYKALQTFQENSGLVSNGCCGIKTWSKLLGV